MRFSSNKLFIITSLLGLMLLSGCSSEEAVKPVNEQPLQSENNSNGNQKNDAAEPFDGIPSLLKAANETLNKPIQYITAKEVYEKIVLQKDPNYQIIDVRDTNAFAAGNIEGSVNIPYARTADQLKINQLPKDKTIVVVCFSGHTASQTAAFWNMLGYDAIPMLNGMGGWTSNKDLGAPIAAKAFDFPVNTVGNPLTRTFELPTLSVNESESLDEMLVFGTKAYFETERPAVKSPKVVFEEIIGPKDSSYMLVDIRKTEDYNNGHLEGAINIPYTELANDDSIKALDPSKKLILVDYNGHIASKATRILSLLGFEAYPMKDGMRIWTSDEGVNGIAPISNEKIGEYPTKVLNVKLDGDSSGAASCS